MKRSGVHASMLLSGRSAFAWDKAFGWLALYFAAGLASVSLRTLQTVCLAGRHAQYERLEIVLGLPRWEILSALNELDAGGSSNKRYPVYNFQAGGTYTLTINANGSEIRGSISTAMIRRTPVVVKSTELPWILGISTQPDTSWTPK